MNYLITAPRSFPKSSVVNLPFSKSISNRALILDALTGFNCKLSNLSKANDTAVLQRMLKQSDGKFLDAEDAGTVLRFATVYFSLIEGEHFISGTERLMNRPMQPLIEIIKRLGGNVGNKKVDGKKVLYVKGGKLKGGEVTVDASESSQFISALLLCAPAMQNGLVINLKGKIVSSAYIDMTLGLLSVAGVQYRQSSKKITVPHQVIKRFKLKIENDWSSASYFYSLLSTTKSGSILLKGLKADSLQGDSILMDLMETFGITSVQKDEGILITKSKVDLPKSVTIDAKDFPDLVPALTVAALCNGVEIKFKGVGHLRLKESDRINGLVENIKRLGGKTKITKDGFVVERLNIFPESVHIKTYDDHRMAMAFSVLAMRSKNVVIENPLVVKKSFPNYWSEIKKLGFGIKQV